MTPFDGKILTVSEILTFQTFDLKNLGQGHRVQHSVRSQILTTIKVTARIFTPALNISGFDIFFPETVGQSLDVQHSQWRHSTANARLPISCSRIKYVVL